MEKIVESNRIIAEFMELPAKPLGYYENIWNQSVIREIDGSARIASLFKPEQMGYHTSWSWLMPVIEKIETLVFNKDCGDGVSVSFRYVVEIKSTYCCIEADNTLTTYQGFRTFDDNKLSSTYISVLKFLRWYNPSNIHTTPELLKN